MNGRPHDPEQGEARVQDSAGRPTTERIERVEERLVADVRAEEAGHVRARKRVVEEPEEIEVALRHDEVELARRKVDRRLQPGEEPVRSAGGTTVLLVIEERLEVRRVPWVVEEIHLRRRLVSERQRVTDTVRKERWEMSTQGEIELEER